MKTLKEILKKDKHIWFEIADGEKIKFLEWAKDNGCCWMDGSKIQPQLDNCGYHMGINKFLEMGFVGIACWFTNARNKPKKIDFGTIIKDERS